MVADGLFLRNCDGLSVGGDVDVGREETGGVVDETHVVAEMGEVGAARTDGGNDIKGFVKRHVRHVFLATQSVDDECVYAADFDESLCRHLRAVGDVGEIPDAKANNRQLCVHYG